MKLYYQPSKYTYEWSPNTGSDGLTIGELFPGTYLFEASYNDTKTGFVEVDISKEGVDHTFVATLVTLNFPGCSITYQAKYKNTFSQPSMALFPGTYDFTFKFSDKTTITR